jgi:hypothetical protein
LSSRVISGLLSEQQSVATGLMMGLVIWTLTRLVDGVLGTGTIEYQISHSPTTLASGTPGTEIRVTLTNLSRSTSVNGLEVSIADPRGKTTFSNERPDWKCVFEPPAWAEGALCHGAGDGMVFEAPMLVPGTYVVVGTKYTQAAGATEAPIVRIRPKDGADFRLLEAGLQTWIARHELGLLLSLLGLASLLFAMAVRTRRAPRRQR